jgi:hypothetical protein
MCTYKVRAIDEPNLASSFKTAFVAEQGEVAQLFIKYAMYDGSSRLSLLSRRQFLDLCRCIEHYCGIHYYGSDLQRVSDEPGYATQVPKRHPIHTMTNDRPNFIEEDFLAAVKDFAVASLLVIDKGEWCCLQHTFLNGTRRVDMLPAYVAMNLYGSLKASIDMSGLISAPSLGSA